MTLDASRLIDVERLTVEFVTRDGVVSAVRDVSFSLRRGETLGIVGESGSGKSVTSLALMRILDENGQIAEGEMRYSGIDLRRAEDREMNDIRGREISMIFQNPRGALNPIRKVGQQIEDVLRQHAQATVQNARERAIALLETVRIADPEIHYHAYPHELSGGMCQRVVIAIALACEPRVLIADEPTTGLDVTTQKMILDLVSDLTDDRGMSTILITHDLALAAGYCDRIAVMKSGEVIETAASSELFASPRDPYTRALISATPRRDAEITDLLPEEDRRKRKLWPNQPKEAPTSGTPLLSVKGLTKKFDKAAKSVLPFRKSGPDTTGRHAVYRINFDVMRGESVGLVGESGCGKSTTSLMLMRLLDPTSGSIELNGQDIAQIPAKHFSKRPERPHLQMIFQDPTDSLNPRFTAARCIADPIQQLGGIGSAAHIDRRVAELADMVRLPRELLQRFPHQLSGGQKARVGIARAIALSPAFLVLDEPTAALDVSVQAVVLNLLADLRKELAISYLFVSHDLNVVRLLCDRVIVMRAGQIVEQGDIEQVMERPVAHYTRQLLDACPEPPTSSAAALR